MRTLPEIPGLTIWLSSDGRIQTTFPYHPDNVARIKQIPGKRWHPTEKRWSIPASTKALALVQQLFKPSMRLCD